MNPALANDYRVHARMGSGTTGALFRASRTGDDRTVVLKALHPDFAGAMDIAHLRRVCDALASVDHHAIPAGTRLCDWRGDQVVVRDYIRGVDLATVVAGSAPPKRVALHLTSELAGALAKVLEQTGFAHGDVKPSNVFLDLAGDISVVDFGMARPLQDKRDRTLTLFHGSVGFMAPERLDNRQSEQSDVYSVGLLLAWMLTGELPRRTSSNPARHEEQRQRLLELVQASGSPLSAIRIIERCTAFSPSSRPKMADLARQLAEAAANVQGPSVRSWAGPLIEALIVQPNETEITDVGQSLSVANSAPRLPTPGGARPVSRIRTDSEPPFVPNPPRRAPLGLALGVGTVLIAIAMVAGALSLAARG